MKYMIIDWEDPIAAHLDWQITEWLEYRDELESHLKQFSEPTNPDHRKNYLEDYALICKDHKYTIFLPKPEHRKNRWVKRYKVR